MKNFSTKHSLLFAAVSAASAIVIIPAQASYQMRAVADEHFSNWRVAPPTEGPWANQGGHTSCSAWTPNTTDVTLGQSFIQSRSCGQVQTRVVTSREQDSFTGAFRVTSTQTESRTLHETETRQAVGELGSGSGGTGGASSSAASSSAASSTAGSGGSGGTGGGGGNSWTTTSPTVTDWVTINTLTSNEWTPAVANQTASFTQTRGTQLVQEQYTQARELDLATGHYRDVGSPVRSERTISGEDESRLVTVSASAPTVVSSDCSEWTPAASTVNYGQEFTQTRSCTANQTRTYSFSVGGSWTDSYTVNNTNSQQAIGEYQAWVPAASTFTPWVDSGSPYDLTAWTPVIAAQHADFTQSRTFSQNQTCLKQKREMDTVTGQFRNVGEPTTQTRVLTSQAESRPVVVSNAGWVNTSVSAATAWSPAAGSQTNNFNQSRTVTQDQSRTWTYKDAGGAVLGTSSETQSLAGQLEERLITANLGNWVSTGDFAYTSWTPAISNQTSNFTQSRTAADMQTRTITYTAPDNSVIGTYSQPRTLTPVTENRVVTASSPGWSATTQTGLTAWTPAYGNQTANYTQSQSYTQNKSRVWTYTAPDASVLSTWTETGSDTVTNTQNIVVTVGSWANSGAQYGCTAWSPLASTVTAGQTFTQSNTCSQDQTRTYTHKLNSATVYTRNETQTISANNSQQATGTMAAVVCSFYDSGTARKDAGFGPYTYVYKNNWYYKGTQLATGNAGNSVTTGGKTYTRGAVVVGGSYPEEEVCTN